MRRGTRTGSRLAGKTGKTVRTDRTGRMYCTERYNRQEEVWTKQTVQEGREGEERRKGQAVDEEQKGQTEEEGRI